MCKGIEGMACFVSPSHLRAGEGERQGGLLQGGQSELFHIQLQRVLHSGQGKDVRESYSAKACNDTYGAGNHSRRVRT